MCDEIQKPPEGFIPFDDPSPFMQAAGPFYTKGAGHDLSIGAFVCQSHLNRMGYAHGGFIATFADTALGFAFGTLTDPRTSVFTLSMTVDYTGTARLGDWIESRVELHKAVGRIKFANVYLLCNQKKIARASAVYSTPESNPAPES